MFLEVIVTSPDDCMVINQFEKYVQRIELCVNLKKGGFTPSFDVIEECLKVSKVPINIMLRLKNSFVLSEDDVKDLMATATYIIKQFSRFKSLNGFVFGAITKDNKMDMKAMTSVYNLVKPYTLVCHRCFEKVANKNEALEELEKLGIEEILYSAITVDEISKLKMLKTKIKFLIGGGVNFNNKLFLLNNNLRRFHIGSCVRYKEKWKYAILADRLNDFINLKSSR